MSLERNKEDVQPTEQRAYYSREKLKRDAQRIHNQSNHASISKPQEVEKQAEIPLLELDQINLMIRDLAQQSGAASAEAKRDERVLLLTAATLQMCQLLKNYSETTNTAMEKIAERELQNLNIQSQYAESVKASIVSIARDIYYQFKDEQAQAFKDVQKYLSDSCDEMEKEINACTAEVKKTTVTAVKASKSVTATTRKLRRVKTFGDFMYYTAPIFVAVDFIAKVIWLFMQR